MFQAMTVGCVHRAHACHLTFRTWLGAGLLLLVALVAPSHAMAATCTTSFTVASSGSYQFSAVDCDTYGAGTNGPGSWIVAAPSHGTITRTALPTLVVGTGVTYTNNGDGATSDSFVWQSSDGVNHTVTVTITPPASTITLSPASFSFTLGSTVNTTITASGGTGPYTYAVSAGTLPTGLSLASNGTLSGEVKGFGSYNFTVTATDSTTATGSKAYTGTIATVPPTISPSTLPSAFVNRAYSQTLTASGGVAPYTFSLDSSSSPLPTGLTLTSGGVISGTPTTVGNYSNIVVDVTDSSVDMSGGGGINGSQQIYSITVSPQPTITVSPSTLTAATVGAAYSQSFSAGGGTAPYAYAVTSGALPASMSLSSTGTLSGTPTASGTFNFTVTATDTNSFTGSQAETLTVNAPTITLSPTTLPSGTDGTAYSQTITASGGTASYTYAVTSGTLPTGMSLSAGGLLSGTPAGSGTFNFTVTATDSSTGTGPYTGSLAYTLTINAAAPVANPVSTTVAYDSTANPITLNLSGGTPTSVAVATQASHGTATAGGTSITYTPTPGYAGSDSFTYTATNSAGTSAPATVSITVSNPTLAITSSSGGTSLTATVGQPFTQTFTFSGGKAPYSGYSITGIPAGLQVTAFNSTSITVSGTPTASGTFQLTVSGTDSSTGNGPFTVSQNFSLNIASATMAISPSTLPGATAGTAYSQTFSTTGGISPYTYTVSSGALPAGLSLSASGILSGTPTTAGSYNFTVNSADSSTGAGSPATTTAAYTLTVSAPTLTVTPASLPGGVMGSAYSQTLGTSGGTAPYTYAVTTGTLPAGLSLSSSGTLSGTPTVAGNFAFTVTTTDSLGFTGAKAYTLAISAPAPVANNDSVSALTGQSVTIPVTNNDTGSITSINIVQVPAHGTATVSGTSVVYTSAAGFSGADTFTYTDTGPSGTSAPATVMIQVNPKAIAPNLQVNAVAGGTVDVDLTAHAQGGPFTAANLVSVTPSASGSGQIVKTASGYSLKFTPASSYSGVAAVTYTLSNAYSTSAPAVVSINVTMRPDPTKDPDVMGILGAQTDSTRRFARGQIDNFNRRLEQLHGGGGGSLFGNYLSVTFLGPYPVLATVASLDPSSGISDQNGQNSLNVPIGHLTKASVRADKSHSKFLFWVGGGINFGSTSADANHSSIDFNSTGISLGADTRVSDRFAFGTGIGFGHGKSDVGSNGSRNVSNAYSLAVYGSFSPTKSTYLDGVLGYQRLFFDTRRYVAADGNLIDGNRHGGQVFGSLSLGQEQHYGTLSLSPYGRMDMSSAQLNAYTEQGDATYALHYDSQTVRTITGSLGLRANWQFRQNAWNIQPLLRAEYRHDFQGSSVATMSYADLVSGPVYQANLDMYSRNSWVGGIGLQVQNHNGLALEVEYQNQLLVGSGSGKNNSVFLNLKAPF